MEQDDWGEVNGEDTAWSGEHESGVMKRGEACQKGREEGTAYEEEAREAWDGVHERLTARRRDLSRGRWRIEEGGRRERSAVGRVTGESMRGGWGGKESM